MRWPTTRRTGLFAAPSCKPAEARDWSGADLEAARAVCRGRLDFARLLPEVDRQLA